MKEPLGKFLSSWRIRTVLPHIHGNLLDIGCGTNSLLRSYRGKGVGIDVYQWGDVDIVVQNSAELPFGNEAFDTITIIAALNHIPNREEVLAECHRISGKRGRIIITMIPPGISRIWHFLRKPWDADQKERGMKPGEVFGMTSHEVYNLLKGAGFNVLFEKRFMMGINHIIVAEKE